MNSYAMDSKIYGQFRDLVFEHSGIFLGDHKQALVTARIGKRMRALGLAAHKDYLKVVASDDSGTELGILLDAISTNVTHFFRESRHFEILAELVKSAAESNNRSFDIWCAAASTGEEPYSIAMTGLENTSPSMQIKIIASDIATSVLQKAKTGIYRASDVEAVDKTYIKKYFQKGVTARALNMYRVQANLRAMVEFKQINLSTPPFPVQGNLDAIFCRNVMIYFNTELRQLLVENLFSLLKPGGYLFVGMAESLSSIRHNNRPVEPSVYKKS